MSRTFAKAARRSRARPSAARAKALLRCFRPRPGRTWKRARPASCHGSVFFLICFVRLARTRQGVRACCGRVSAGPVHRGARYRHRHACPHGHPERSGHRRADGRVDHHHLYACLRGRHSGDGQAGGPFGTQVRVPCEHPAVRCRVASMRVGAGRGELLDAVSRARRAGGGRRRHRACCHGRVRHDVSSREARAGVGSGRRRVRHCQHLRSVGRQPDPIGVRAGQLAVHLLRERSHLHLHRGGGAVRAAEHASRAGEAHRRVGHCSAGGDGVVAAVRTEEPRFLRSGSICDLV